MDTSLQWNECRNKVCTNASRKSPEFMPLDNSLNRDLQCSHDYHCAVTSHLEEDDNRKFSKKTPRRIARGIKRIWDCVGSEGVPSSKRIIEDVVKALSAMRKVEEEGGKIVPKLVARSEHRYRKEGRMGGHGGKRVKNIKQVQDKWLHHLAVDAKSEREEENRQRFLMR